MNRFNHLISALFLLLALGCSHTPQNPTQVTSYVNPFIGTDFHGHTYPGATLPFGMVQLSPDTRTTGWDACSGYHYSDSVILGFSHTHLSGTGIGDMGDVLIMPFTGKGAIKSGENEPLGSGYKSTFDKTNESAKPGYYSVLLNDYNILAEMSATLRTGIHRYTFKSGGEAGFVLDLNHVLHHHEVVSAHLQVVSPTEIRGFRKIRGWAKDRQIAFSARFSKPFTAELFSNDSSAVQAQELNGTHLKALLRFDATQGEQVLVKVGISNVDEAGAAMNAEVELPGFDFDTVVKNAQLAWEKELSKMQVKGGSHDEKVVFYTALYHSNLSPIIYSDVDGRYLGQDQHIHQSEQKNYTVFSLWDTYRTQHPLFTLIKSDYNQDLIRSLLRKHTEGGILPMWDLASVYTGTMIGSHAVSVIADAYMKGDRSFDAEKALMAMIQAVEYDSVRHINYPNADFIPWIMPKGKLYDKLYGYIPCDLEHSSTSRGLEFAYNYWCIARMAEEMGKNDIAMHYYERSQHYNAYFDAETGFMRGKRLDGTWDEPFNPRHSAHWKTPYVEGNAWQWSWYVPHDVPGLIALHGGKEAFATKLDSLFTITSEVLGEEKSADITGLIGQYAHGNEPSHHIAYLFNYADQPWRTQELVQQIRSEFYTNTPDGLCGNEDCGQMSAWYIMNAMGFYPVCPGDNRYSIGVPVFDEMTIEVGQGKKLSIKKLNATPENRYVQKVLWNGTPLTTHQISHHDLIKGGELAFEMTKNPSVFWQ